MMDQPAKCIITFLIGKGINHYLSYYCAYGMQNKVCKVAVVVVVVVLS